ncbi:MAG: DUF1893 domain-containing protein [Candidatus Moranbacteria bacterium]|nr:DUF1893 domain-containing protein [Candidatus Moranbacteria bacterium]
MKYNLEYFFRKDWSFVLIKNGKIVFKSKAERLKPLILCIKKHKKEMRGAIVFDKIIGRAAAVLLISAKVKEVWTPTISRSGKAYLVKNKVKIGYKNLVECIMNRNGDDLCPMEKMSQKMPEKEFIGKLLKK